MPQSISEKRLEELSNGIIEILDDDKIKAEADKLKAIQKILEEVPVRVNPLSALREPNPLLTMKLPDGAYLAHYAAKRGFVDITIKLIPSQVYADADGELEVQRLQDLTGRTPWHYFAGAGRVSALTCLSAHFEYRNQYLGARDNSGQTLLHKAALNGKTEFIAALLKLGTDAGVVDNLGQTVLHCACIDGNEACARLILQQFTSDSRRREFINSRDRQGNTALMYAAMRGNFGLLVALCEAGANVELGNATNNTAIDIALAREDGPGVRYLLGKKAKLLPGQYADALTLLGPLLSAEFHPEGPAP